jgi:hypothetical protein
LISNVEIISLISDPEIISLISNPNIINLISDPEIISLISNPEIISLISNPNIINLISDPEIISLISNPNIINLISNVEIISLISNPEIISLISNPNIISLISDPEIISLISNPEIISLISNPNIISLISDPEIISLISNPTIINLISDPDILNLISDPEIILLISNPNIISLISNPEIISLISDSEIINILLNPNILSLISNSHIITLLSDPSLLTLISNPVIISLLSNQNIINLLSDPSILTLLSNSDIINLLSNETILNLLSNPSIISLIYESNLISILNNPIIINILSNPDIINLISDPNIINIISNPLIFTLLSNSDIINLISDPTTLNIISNPVVLNLISDPSIINIISNPLIISLISNPTIINLLSNSELFNLLSNPSIIEFLFNPSVINLLSDPSLVSLLFNESILNLLSEPDIADLLSNRFILTFLINNPSLIIFLLDNVELLNFLTENPILYEFLNFDLSLLKVLIINQKLFDTFILFFLNPSTISSLFTIQLDNETLTTINTLISSLSTDSSTSLDLSSFGPLDLNESTVSLLNLLFLISKDTIYKASYFYLIAYDLHTINNNDIFIQTENMKKKISTSIINNTEKIEPKFDNIFKFFKYIKFYFGNQMIEELNELNYNIYYNLNINEDERNKFDNLTKIRLSPEGQQGPLGRYKNKWEVYFPLIFWFNNKPGLSIPLLALPHIDLRLEYELNTIEYILNLDNKYTLPLIKPTIKINLINDVILLDTEERKLFGSYSHEYIIERFISYSNVFIKDISFNVSKKLNNLVKDIYIITTPINSNENYYKTIINDYDDKYYRYTQALYYYNEFIKYKYYTSIEQNNYIEDIEIITNILLDINNFINNTELINNQGINNQINRICKNFNINLNTNLDLLKLIMFIENKYYNKLSDTKKNYLLHIYIKYQYKNNQIINKISPIEKMSIKINGVDLFTPRDYIYFQDIIPYQKFNNSLPYGYYTYTFSLFPNEMQPSGYLNFSHFDDISFNITSNSNVLNNPYKLNIIVKEYNILRIMSGMGGLAWI